MRDDIKKKDRTADFKVLEECISKADQAAVEADQERIRAQQFEETSKRNFDAFLNFKPVPSWGTGRK
jgi:hypothetical protein